MREGGVPVGERGVRRDRGRAHHSRAMPASGKLLRCSRNASGVAIRSPVRVTRAGPQCTSLEEMTPFGRACMALTTPSRSFRCRNARRIAGNSASTASAVGAECRSMRTWRNQPRNASSAASTSTEEAERARRTIARRISRSVPSTRTAFAAAAGSDTRGCGIGSLSIADPMLAPGAGERGECGGSRRADAVGG